MFLISVFQNHHIASVFLINMLLMLVPIYFPSPKLLFINNNIGLEMEDSYSHYVYHISGTSCVGQCGKNCVLVVCQKKNRQRLFLYQQFTRRSAFTIRVVDIHIWSVNTFIACTAWMGQWQLVYLERWYLSISHDSQCNSLEQIVTVLQQML